MFVLYAVSGAWVPVLSVHLKDLAFSPVQIGWVGATYALAALATPFLAGQMADRWFPAERCLAAFALTGGCLLWLLAELADPVTVFCVCLAVWLVLVPATTLSISICFTHLPDPARQYGSVRMWGTVGWVAAGLVLGWWRGDPAWLTGLMAWLRPGGPQSEWADALRFAGLLSFALAGLALTLPHTPPARRRRGSRSSWLAPLAALHLLRRRNVAVYCACALGVCVSIPFNSLFTPLLLQRLGVPPGWVPQTLTLAQSMEIVTLASLPWILGRLGVRGTMVLGLLASVLLMAALSCGEPLWLVAASLGLNGVCICCYLVAGQVFVNGQARRDVRASTQSLLTFANGLGQLIGNVLSGWVHERAGGAFAPTFAAAAAVSAGALGLFLIGFRDAAEEPEPAARAGPAEPLVRAQKMT